MFRKILIISGIFILAGTFWFAALRMKNPAVPVGKPEVVTVGVEVGILTAPLLVAQEKGYFKEQGLDVQIRPYQAGKLALEAMLRGEPLDMATVGPVPIAIKALDRNDFSILTTFVYSESDDKIVARKDKGIAAGGDLKGKKVGATFGTSGQFFLTNYIVLSGLSPADVRLVDLKPNDLPEALVNGEVADGKFDTDVPEGPSYTVAIQGAGLVINGAPISVAGNADINFKADGNLVVNTDLTAGRDSI